MPSNPEHRDLVRSLLPFMTIALVIALAYAAYTWYSRRQATREMQQRSQQQQAPSLPPEYQTDKVKILSFTIDPAAIARGSSAQLCYGVMNAKTVSFDPPLPGAEPTSSHCLTIRPPKTTAYKLTAQGVNGGSESATLTIRVR